MFLAPVAVLLSVLLQQPPCGTGQVIAVNRGYDYTIDVCGVGAVGLRGVEPPLRTPPVGELLGNRDVSSEAQQFFSDLVVGKRVKLTYDGWRIGDREGRRYAYAYLPDGRLLNADLIRRGFAYAARAGSHPMRAEFLAIEETARRAKVGVWAP